MSGLVLYRAIASPPARAVMTLGDLLGLRFEYREVKLLQFEHKSEEYKKVRHIFLNYSVARHFERIEFVFKFPISESQVPKPQEKSVFHFKKPTAIAYGWKSIAYTIS